jgi:hypothetical protein
MRPLLKYGVPAAAGLAAGGYALSQGEDPGSAAFAAGAGALGGAAGLLGARMAGKYSPQLAAAISEKAAVPIGNVVGNIGRNLPAESKIRAGAVGETADVLAGLENLSLGPVGQRTAAKVAGAAFVPAAAGLAGLGGVAAGAIPGAMGIPGFQQQQYVDPEQYGSSNTMGARASTTTAQYL